MTTLLIDADGLAFQAASGAQTVHKWDDDVHSIVGDMPAAKDIFEGLLDRLLTDVGDYREYILCWSCPSRRYFRHDILPTYKGGRRSGSPPMLLADVKTWAQEAFPSKVKPHLEADDVMGILATHPKLIPGKKIIVSDDKDMMQIPGFHFKPRSKSTGVVTPEDAERFLWMQVLTGDPTDNYTGIPKIGPKKAEKILDNRRPDEGYLEPVLEAYVKAGLTKYDLAVQVNVARILQYTDYDFKKKEPHIWSL